MLAEWPTADPSRDDKQSREQMETLIGLITKVRNIRSEMNIPVQSRPKLYIGTSDQTARDVVNQSADQIKRLARVEQIEISDTLPELDSAARGIVSGMDLAIPLGGLIDFEKERERVIKEIAKKENEARGLAGRLDNISFVERAPAEVVQEARARHEELISEIEKLRDTLASLK